MPPSDDSVLFVPTFLFATVALPASVTVSPLTWPVATVNALAGAAVLAS